MMIAYPISIDNSGGLTISSDPNVDNVIALIDTNYYERCMFPNYGVNLFAFDPVTSYSIDTLLLSLNLSIKLWHDFVSSVTVSQSNIEDGQLGLIVSLDNGSDVEVNL